VPAGESVQQRHYGLHVFIDARNVQHDGGEA
jgi:hypothetical protein